MNTACRNGHPPIPTARATLAGGSDLMKRCLVVLLFLVSASGCEQESPLCTAEFVPGIHVDVRDAETGVSLADSTTGLAIDGEHVEHLSPIGGAILAGAYERAGTYTIVLLTKGYHDWVRADIEVEEDACHVHTVVLDARLERESD